MLEQCLAKLPKTFNISFTLASERAKGAAASSQLPLGAVSRAFKQIRSAHFPTKKEPRASFHAFFELHASQTSAKKKSSL